MGEPKNILIVDNDEKGCLSLARVFEKKGYVPAVAFDATTAREIVGRVRLDLAIIDVRLNDNNAPWDNSGIDLAESLPPDLPKIMITAYERWEYRGELPQNVKHFSKQRGKTSELVALVAQIFRDEVKLNHDLEIQYENGLNSSELVQMLKLAEEIDLTTLHHYEQEFTELLRRLFLRADRIFLKRLMPGLSGSGVVLVEPSYYNHQRTIQKGAQVVVKFGGLDDTLKEVDNYQEYIEPFSLMYTTHLIGTVARTKKLAGAKFMFVGRNEDHSLTHFANVYGWPQVTNRQLEKIIQNLFHSSCQLWYLGKRDWSQAAGDPSLYDSYRQQLSFQEPRAVQKLDHAMAEILAGGTLRRVCFGRADAQHLYVQIHPAHKEQFVDPLLLLIEGRDCFPAISFMAITHGDLNGYNIFVDGERTWLIDFARTGWGPALRDAAELEAVIKFDLIKTDMLSALLEFEACLLQPRRLDEEIPLTPKLRRDPIFMRAKQTIETIRREAARIADYPDDMLEYCAGLYFYALKMMTLRGISSSRATDRYETRRRHALYSAGKIATMLYNHQR